MYQPKTDPNGLVQENNRVSLPAINDFTEVYTKLPSGMWSGFTAELEGYKGILLKNAGTALADNIIVQAGSGKYATHQTVPDSAAFWDIAKGDREIHVAQASITEDTWVDDILFLRGHPFPYKIVRNTPSSNLEGVADVVTLTLNRPLIKATPSGTPLTREDTPFESVTAGAVGSEKTLGMTFNTVAPNLYFWAVFYGKVQKTVTAAVGDYIVKAASGGIQKLEQTAGAEDFDDEIIGIYEGSNIINLDIAGIAA